MLPARIGSLMIAAALLTGCATRIDWKSRVGSYTYDQAVRDMGPPDKQAKLGDGTTVAEWLTYRGGTRYYGYGPGWWHLQHHHGTAIIVNDYPSYESFLRLIFDADGKLNSWKKYTR